MTSTVFSFFALAALHCITAIPMNGYGNGKPEPTKPPPPTPGSYVKCSDGSAALPGFNGQPKPCTIGDRGYASCPYGYECVPTTGAAAVCCSRTGSSAATAGGNTMETAPTMQPESTEGPVQTVPTEGPTPPSSTSSASSPESIASGPTTPVTEPTLSTAGVTDASPSPGPESPPPPPTMSIPGEPVTPQASNPENETYNGNQTTAGPESPLAPETPSSPLNVSVPGGPISPEPAMPLLPVDNNGTTPSSPLAPTSNETAPEVPTTPSPISVPGQSVPQGPAGASSKPNGGNPYNIGGTSTPLPPAVTDLFGNEGNASSNLLSNAGPSQFSIQSAMNSLPNAVSFRKSVGPPVPTSGQFTPCSTNADCFPMREPPEWCRKATDVFVWTDKSCFCAADAQVQSCIIERYDVITKETQWTYCAPKQGFECAF